MFPRLPEALDQSVPDRESRLQRDLLRRDRGDERLVGLRRQRRPEAGQGHHEPRQNGVVLRPRVERVELKLGAEQLPDDVSRRLVQRLDLDTAGSSLDPHLAPADDAVQPALVPEVRAVGPEGAKALGRELEVVRLGKGEQRHRARLAAAPSPAGAA